MGKQVQLIGGAIAMVALGALTACDGMANTRLDFSATEPVAVTEIQVAGGSGDITVRGDGTAGQVRIERVVRYRGAEPARTYRFDGTILHIDTDCGRHCDVSYVIQAPAGVAVRGENGSGDIALADVGAVDVELGSGSITIADGSADVSARTGSGDITASAVAGDLSAEAGSGSIEVHGVLGGQASVRTGSGDLTVVLAEPGSVDAAAASGDIDVMVPDGSYRVQVSTGSGNTDVGVTDDPAGTHLLKLDSGSGDITVASG